MLHQTLARFGLKHHFLILAVWLSFAGVQGLAQAKTEPQHAQQTTPNSARVVIRS